SRKNVDAFTHYHGPSRGFDAITFLPPPKPFDLRLPVSISLVGLALLLLLLSLVYIRRLRVKKEKSLLRAHRMSVRESIETQRSLDFGMVLDSVQRAREFAQGQTIVVFSHQWHSWENPDPNRSLHACMADVISQLVKRGSLIEKTWVWLDCVPQVNLTQQVMAYSDLPAICELSSYFIIIAPPAQHDETDERCDIHSYEQSGWWVQFAPHYVRSARLTATPPLLRIFSDSTSLIRLETPDHALADGEDSNVSINGISTTKEQFDEITLSEQPSRAQMRTTSFAPKRLRAARAPQPGVPSGSSQVDGPSLSQVFSLAMLANKFMPSTAKTSPSEDQAPENASSVRKISLRRTPSKLRGRRYLLPVEDAPGDLTRSDSLENHDDCEEQTDRNASPWASPRWEEDTESDSRTPLNKKHSRPCIFPDRARRQSNSEYEDSTDTEKRALRPHGPSRRSSKPKLHPMRSAPCITTSTQEEMPYHAETVCEDQDGETVDAWEDEEEDPHTANHNRLVNSRVERARASNRRITQGCAHDFD
ncbi:MAG: hypothetical protein SGPRY_008365, partial [Prymnesium sp.]